MAKDSDLFSLDSKTPTVLGGALNPNRQYEKVKAFTKAEARAANRAEHDQTVRQAVHSNKKAIFWSLVISMAIIMEGYDTALMPQFYGYPSFQRRYGQFFPGIQEWSLTGEWQAGLSNAQAVGVILGGFINGWASSRFGYKKTMLAALFWINFTIFAVFFAQKVWVLMIGQFLCGLGWGVFATTGPAYASVSDPLPHFTHSHLHPSGRREIVTVGCIWILIKFTGSLSLGPPRLPDCLQQPLLGHGTAARQRRSEGAGKQRYGVELPNSLRGAVGMAAAAVRPGGVLAREPVVAGQEGKICGGGSQPTSTVDQGRERDSEHSGPDRLHHQARKGKHCPAQCCCCLCTEWSNQF